MSRYDDEICFPFTHNKFGDVVVVSQLFSERLLRKERFAAELERSLQIWRDRGLKGVEFVISPEHSHLIPELTKLGFAFYLAAADRLVMNCWIGEQPSQFPTELCWEFPGGMSRNDENLLETAEAKVLEKTGVVARSQCIISLS
ncbi:unnamed protein product [Heligmosomoides polygyrus]|uniref:Nudix_hydro domain-containing protein n=1 Tax=Heligmosomoides polygyrus TaxID=6339 RepID=A0A183GF54_HELPZ|nr:unnamed protein product [Heligmosomoides polygyrus]